jgi:O-antigen/teichoic acid export membrane protein
VSLTRRTITGMFWAYAAFWGRRLFSLITTAILARLLVPADFGLIGYALLLLNFVEAIRSFGINDALIYNSEREEDTANTAFILNVAIGVGQAALTFALSPLSSLVYDDPMLVKVIQLMALAFVFDGLGGTHNALLQKELRFRRRFFPDIVSALIKGIVSVAMALSGFGVWSLAVGHVMGSLTRTIVVWWVMRWLPALRFFRERALALWNYGVYILLFELLNVALEQADQLFIGALLGGVQLGYYTIAARIPELVIANFSIVLTQVLFPSYAKLKDNLKKLVDGYLLTTKYTAFVTVALGCGLAVVAPELVLVVFGDQWGPAVPLFRVLAFLGMTMTLPWAAGDALKAIGRPDISTWLLVIESLYTFPLIWLFASQTRQAVMASLANLIAMCVTTVLRLTVISRQLKFSPLVFFRVFYAPFLAGGTMYGLVTLWRQANDSLPPLLTLITSVLVGGMVYVVILFTFESKDLLAAVGLLVDALRQRPARMSQEEEAVLPVGD